MCSSSARLASLGDPVGALDHGLGGRVALGDLDQLRRVEQRVGELLDLARERRREQQVLPLRRSRQQRHDALDVGDEAHVEHAVGLVEHEDLDLPEIDALVLDVVEQPAGGGDQDLDPGAHDRQLLLDVDAAEDDGRAQVRVPRVGAHRLLDLDREFARRGEDQRAHRMARGRRAGVGERRQLLQDRQREARGLAGAGLGAAHDVLAGEDHGYRLRLDRRRRGIAGLGHGLQQLRPQAELGKARCVHWCSWTRPLPLRDFRSRLRTTGWTLAGCGNEAGAGPAERAAGVPGPLRCWAVTGTAARSRSIA